MTKTLVYCTNYKEARKMEGKDPFSGSIKILARRSGFLYTWMIFLQLYPIISHIYKYVHEHELNKLSTSTGTSSYGYKKTKLAPTTY